MTKNNTLLLLLTLSGLLLSCGQSDTRPPLLKKLVNYDKYPAMTEAGYYNAVIEIPAGTNRKIEYNKAGKKFETDQRNGKDRIINFLGYPGNYGYIPGTLAAKANGGDGDALDVLVLAESVPTGTVTEVKLIAALRLADEGEEDTKFIAIPADTTLQTMQIADFEDFMINYDAVRRMTEDWFLNYDGPNTNRLLGWKDEVYARRQIEKQRIQK